MFSKRLFWLELILLLIITIPLFASLLNNFYFPMHDDQHIARLYLLDNAIHQGYYFPRWVDMLGFSFGYPLFNFYPPFIYYLAELFRLVGFSLVWSIKLMIITGFLLSALGMFLFARKKIGLWGGLLAATLYSYSFYHAVLVYVRGAFAEFFTLAILPFVFLTFENLWEEPKTKNFLFFAIALALLIITHPLIAFPTLFFLAVFTLFFLSKKLPKKIESLIKAIVGTALGLGLAAFFWLPSLTERKYTLLDRIFPTELSYYQLHFVCPQQLLYSLWGYGGSISGCADGMTFQLGKIHIFLFLLALVTATVYFIHKKKPDRNLSFFFLYGIFALFAIFMTTEYSQSIWQTISYFQYLQFPWRFLSFASFFLSLAAAFNIYFLLKLFSKNRWENLIVICTLVIIFFTAGYYQKYFRPAKYLVKTEEQLTSFNEIAWRVSRSSFDFLPADIPVKQSEIHTTIPAISPNDLETRVFNAYKGSPKKVDILKNTMREKEFNIDAFTPLEFWLYTVDFPGWKAYLDGKEILIFPNETFKLISVKIPQGYHNLRFFFEDTLVRKIANAISLIATFAVLYLLLGGKSKQIKRRFSSGFNKPLNKLDR